ncbi:hypothetical protein ACFYR1_47050 [Streptomyces canus]|uniref:hypothetical protein n=1 Tax=Streptomyces canus TaxID=58343 RepID=UPI0036C24BC2
MAQLPQLLAHSTRASPMPTCAKAHSMSTPPLARRLDDGGLGGAHAVDLAGVGSLEGLVRRDPDPPDRRAALAVLTDKGGQALDHALTAHVSHFRKHVAGPLAVEDRRHLERILRTLRDANA